MLVEGGLEEGEVRSEKFLEIIERYCLDCVGFLKSSEEGEELVWEHWVLGSLEELLEGVEVEETFTRDVDRCKETLDGYVVEEVLNLHLRSFSEGDEVAFQVEDRCDYL